MTPEARKARQVQRLREELVEQQARNAQILLMLTRIEDVQRSINTVLARWANEMLQGIVKIQEPES